MKTKKIARILCAGVLCLSALLTLSACGSDSADSDGVPVQSVASITGHGNVGYRNRFSGIVVAGRTESINLDEGFTVDELLVEEGQQVRMGQVLFKYNNEALQLSLEQAELELETMKNTIESNNQTIARLEKLVTESSSASDKLSYTLEIQSLQMQNKENEYNISLKQAALERQRAAMVNTEVKSPVTGTVTSVNTTGKTDDYGNLLPYIVISETDNLRIKGTVNELNISAVTEGSNVTILSRVDDNARWIGAVESIDYESAGSNNGDGYYYDGPTDEMSSTSKYTFYVTLSNSDGLMMGQHVYIQSGVELEQDDALLLPVYYINGLPEDPWVWAKGSNGKLEKRELTLSRYQPESDSYVVEDGLTFDDFITMDNESYKAGMKTYEVQEMLPPSDNGEFYGEEGAYPDGGEYYEEGEVYPNSGEYEEFEGGVDIMPASATEAEG